MNYSPTRNPRNANSKQVTVSFSAHFLTFRKWRLCAVSMRAARPQKINSNFFTNVYIRIRNWTTKKPGKCRTLCSNVYFIHHPIQYVASNCLSCISPPLQEKKSVTPVYSLNNEQSEKINLSHYTYFYLNPALQTTYKWAPLIKYSGSLAATRRASELGGNAISVLLRKAVFRNRNYFFRFRFRLLTS